MFRMEFQSDAAEDVNESVYERYRDEVVQTPAIFEGRVGRFGKVHRVVTDLDRLQPWKSRVLSPNANLPGSSWQEAELMNSDHAPCLQGVTQDEAGTQPALFLDAQVLREFTELQFGATGNVRGSEDDDEESRGSGSDSMRSDWSSRSDMSSASEGSVAEMNALQRESKPWEEPLLALHQQAEVDVRVARDAQEEAHRVALQARLEAARQQRELRDLANCMDSSPTRRSFKKKKLQKVLSKTGVVAVCRFLRNPFGLFKTYKIHNGYAARQGVEAVVIPRRAFSETYSTRDAALAQMRAVPRRQARSDIQFATVNSTQRDVPAWTMEEYMTRNAKLHKWNGRKDDEEFGSIEGNNLMNQYFDDDVTNATYDSDSD